MLLDRFISYVQAEQLLLPGGKTLLAVSGGVDSVVMCELFHRAGFKFAIAHCNFQLRGVESEEDEIFVRSLALRYNSAYFSVRFDTQQITQDSAGSVQMIARELRYSWLEEIRKNNACEKIAMAHHRDDAVETFFINLLRGTGIAGLRGIPLQRDAVIRPLLFATRIEIAAFAREFELKYREDSSNTSLKYLRNKVRHQLIPALQEIQPDASAQIYANMERLAAVEQIYREKIDTEKEASIRVVDGKWTIDIEHLQRLKPLATYLFEFVKPFGFSESQVQAILSSLNGIAGKSFYSPTHRLWKDRSTLIVELLQAKDESSMRFNIRDDVGKIERPIVLHWQKSPKNTINLKELKSNQACVDLALLHTELTLRLWKEGDSFIPFGMKGRKKLSDFLIDRKVPMADKSSVWVLLSGEDIIWVIGHRLSEQFKVSESSEQVILFTFVNGSLFLK